MIKIRPSWEFIRPDGKSILIKQDEVLEFRCVEDGRSFNKTGRLKDYVEDMYFVIDASSQYNAYEDRIFYLEIVDIIKVENT